MICISAFALVEKSCDLVGHSLDFCGLQLRKDGQTDHLAAKSLCDRDVALRVAEATESSVQVERIVIIYCGASAAATQMRPKFLSPR